MVCRGEAFADGGQRPFAVMQATMTARLRHGQVDSAAALEAALFRAMIAHRVKPDYLCTSLTWRPVLPGSTCRSTRAVRLLEFSPRGRWGPGWPGPTYVLVYSRRSRQSADLGPDYLSDEGARYPRCRASRRVCV